MENDWDQSDPSLSMDKTAETDRPVCLVGLDHVYRRFLLAVFDTVNKTSLATRIAGPRTLATEEGKQLLLSVTLTDGNNVKYLI